MRIVDHQKEKEMEAFAQKAAEAFTANPLLQSFGEMKQGEPLALRWNPFTVLVLVISEFDEILLYDKPTEKKSESI